MRFTTYEIYGDKKVENSLDIEGYYCPLNMVCQYSGNKNASSCLFVISKDDAEKFEMPDAFTYNYAMCFPDYVLMQLESVVIDDPEKMEKINIEQLNRLLDVGYCFAEKRIPKTYFEVEYIFDENDFEIKPEDLYNFEYYKLIKVLNNGLIKAIRVDDSIIELGQYEIERFAEDSFESFNRGLNHVRISNSSKIAAKYSSKIDSIISCSE